MVVSVTIEHELVVVDAVSHQLDVDTVLLEEINCLESLCFFEGTIIGASWVKIGILTGSLLEASKHKDLTASDLEGAHVEASLGELQLE